MLHLTGGITFGMDVGDLFQLQRALEGDRKIDAASQVEKIRRPEILFRKLFNTVGVVKKMFELNRQLRQLLRVKTTLFLRERAAKSSEIQADQIKRNHLARECFCRSDTDFRSSMREYRSVSFTHDH